MFMRRQLMQDDQPEVRRIVFELLHGFHDNLVVVREFQGGTDGGNIGVRCVINYRYLILGLDHADEELRVVVLVRHLAV